jgi:alkylation response protein AidB-like acyl-CoA dehydrogenase
MSQLQAALDFLATRVAPRAAELDQSSDAVADVLGEMGEANLLGLKCPAEYGGEPLSEPDFREFQQACARTSGVFAFLHTQHQSAVSILNGSDNADLKAEILPGTRNGQQLVGIGFSQLRRPGPPMVTADRVDEVFVIDGHGPWVTGQGFYPQFLVGATTASGEAAFALVPLRDQTGIRLSNPMRLAAMETARTVTVDLNRFLVTWDKVAFVKPAGWIQRNDMINVALQGHFAIGNARAGLDVVQQVVENKGSDQLRASYEQLDDEWERCRDNLTVLSSDSAEETTDTRLEARAWAIDVMQRCAWAAVTASAGAANVLTHPAQRILREALVFTVSAQTSAIRDASIRRLTR